MTQKYEFYSFIGSLGIGLGFKVCIVVLLNC